jgi:hypothetical protein
MPFPLAQILGKLATTARDVSLAFDEERSRVVFAKKDEPRKLLKRNLELRDVGVTIGFM